MNIHSSPMPWEQVCGTIGLDIFRRFLDEDTTAKAAFATIVDSAIAGEYDGQYAGNPNSDVQVTVSCHLMVLAIMNRLYGINALDFYTNDPLRYVRLNCLIQHMLGVQRLTLGWPVYSFGAELLGQTIIYTDAQAPGSDPGKPLLTVDNWRSLPTYDATHPIACTVRHNLTNMARLSGIEPVAHLPAPYSLAAEILGQEQLVTALIENPQFVTQFLELIVERVLRPWCDDLVATVPSVWLELSDATGSPMFIGPDKFLHYAMEPVRKLILDNSWGNRVFVANYRGDKPAGAKSRGRRKRNTSAETAMSFDELMSAKVLCCPLFVTRLEADAVPVEHYTEAAISLKLPLYLGIGAVRLDRNSVSDIPQAQKELHASANSRTRQILRVSKSLRDTGVPRNSLPWPGDLYVEDINAETSIDLFQAVLDGSKEGNAAS